MLKTIFEILAHTLLKKGCQSKVSNEMVNSIDPEETTRYQLSQLNLYCFIVPGKRGYPHIFLISAQKAYVVGTNESPQHVLVQK